MSNDSFSAAKQLKDSGRWRSAVSRAYYAAYAACTHVLLQAGFDVSNAGRPNPSHEQVATMVRHNLGTFSESERRDLAKRYRDLLRSRAMADYDPPSARVIADQVNLRNVNMQWWYVPVAYQQDPDHVYRLFEVFSEVEEQLSEQGVNVLIVPRLLPPPSNLVA